MSHPTIDDALRAAILPAARPTRPIPPDTLGVLLGRPTRPLPLSMLDELRARCARP